MWPKVLNSQPPTTAPTIPNTISKNTPSPVLFTILLATKPAISPKTIHAKNDIEPSYVCAAHQTVLAPPRKCAPGNRRHAIPIKPGGTKKLSLGRGAKNTQIALEI